MNFLARWIPVFVLVLTATTAHAQLPAESSGSSSPPQVEEIKLLVSPAAEPSPALSLSFWASDRDLKPGNSAPFYYRAMLLKQQNAEAVQKEYPAAKTDGWLSVPMSEFPVDDAKKYVDLYRSVLSELEIATTRERCDWDLRVKELQGTEVISFLLHDFQLMRDLGRLLALKARCEVAEGKFAAAVATLRGGYRLAHDTARVPLLINGLIGIAVGATMNQVLLDFIQAPDSPNTFWALKQLPQPLIDIQPALQFEMGMPFQMFPFLADAETHERTPAQWQQLMQQAVSQLSAVGGLSGEQAGMPAWQQQLGAAALAVKAYPQAKKALVSEGLAAEAVEKMPVSQVLAIQAARSYRYTYQEMFKWSLLPYPQSRVRMLETQQRLKKEGYLGQALEGKEVIPIASLLLPALDSVLVATVRSERRFAALETIEAIRMQAAVNHGVLPAVLEQVTVVPPPDNPFTGRPFSYRLEGHRAVLEELSTGVDPARANDRRYLIELRKPAK